MSPLLGSTDLEHLPHNNRQKNMFYFQTQQFGIQECRFFGVNGDNYVP